jgi:hypothetical protein
VILDQAQKSYNAAAYSALTADGVGVTYFWLHIDTAQTTTTTAYDTMTVQVLNSSGTVLGTLATFSNLNHGTGYSQYSYNLSAYAGQSITLKFTGTQVSDTQTSFVIDDTAFNVS